MRIQSATSAVLLAWCAAYSALALPLAINDNPNEQRNSIEPGRPIVPSGIEFWDSSLAEFDRRAEVFIEPDPVVEPPPRSGSPDESTGVNTGSGTGSGGAGSSSGSDVGGDPFDVNAPPAPAPKPATPPPAPKPAPKPDPKPDPKPILIPHAPPEIGLVQPHLERVFKDAMRLTAPGGKYAIGKDQSLLYSGPKDLWDASEKYWREFPGTKAFIGLQRALRSEDEAFYGGIRKAGGDALHQYNLILSAVLALRASGEVKLILPSGGLTGPGVFTRVEWPQLMKSGNVDKVTWVDPNDFNNQHVIWTSQEGKIDFPFNVAPTSMPQH